jgi:hypothetical protein
VQEDRRETLRAGPGAAARPAVATGERGPAPSRWTLRTSRVSVAWLTEYPWRGVWRVLPACGLGVHASCARWFSPDPDSRRQGRRRPRWLRAAARHPDTVVALCWAECGYQRWPEVAPPGGREAAVAQRAGNTQQGRPIGARNAVTGPVHYWAGYLVGRQPVGAFSPQLARAYPAVDRLDVSQDNWNIHPQPDGLTALARSPRINPGWLPPSAPWLNPIEQLWRWLRHDVLKRPRWVEDWPQVNQRVHDFLDQFAQGSPDRLRYVGLVGKGKLATVINTS